MTHKEQYLEFWGYTIGTPEAEEAWSAKVAMMQRRGEAPMVAPDLPGYESPVSGKWIDGRAARREDLKRTGCRPYEDGERQEFARQSRHEEKKADAKLTEAVARSFYQMSEAKRRQLTRW